MNPKISIIVPIYNVEQYLPRCIESILNQTFTDFELILVNDGSQDKSGEVCEKYRLLDKRIKVINQGNYGVSAARNTGVNASIGKYIYFVDPDDWIEKELLQEAYSNIEYYQSDIVFLGIHHEYLNDGKREVNISQSLMVESNSNGDILSIILDLIKSDLFGFTWCKLFKSAIIHENKIQFDCRISLAEDAKFTCEYCNYIEKLTILKKAYYHYIHYNDNSRKTLCSTKVNTVSNKDLIFQSYEKLLLKDLTNLEYKNYLASFAYGILYEELWSICYSKQNRKKQYQQINHLKKLKMYQYLKKNNINFKQRILILFIKSKNLFLFKIYNKILSITS